MKKNKLGVIRALIASFILFQWPVYGVKAVEPLKLMTYNMRSAFLDTGTHAWSERKANLVAAIKNEAPDILGTQEANRLQQADLTNDLKGSGYVAVGNQAAPETITNSEASRIIAIGGVTSGGGYVMRYWPEVYNNFVEHQWVGEIYSLLYGLKPWNYGDFS